MILISIYVFPWKTPHPDLSPLYIMSVDHKFEKMVLNFSWLWLRTTNHDHVELVNFFFKALGHMCKITLNMLFSIIVVNKVKRLYLHLLLPYVLGETWFHILIQISNTYHDIIVIHKVKQMKSMGLVLNF